MSKSCISSVFWALSLTALFGRVEAQILNEGAVRSVSSPFVLAEPQLGIFWTSPGFGGENATAVRIHLTEIVVPDHTEFELQFVARDGSIVDRMRPEELKARNEFWSEYFLTSQAFVRVVKTGAGDPPAGLSFRVDQYAARQADVAGPLSDVGTDDSEELYLVEDPALKKLSAAVAKLSFVRANGEFGACTGFLVSKNVLVTNSHCVPDARTCESTVAIFGYEYWAVDKLARSKQYNCSRLVSSGIALDYAVLELEASPGLEFGFLELDDRAARAGEDLIVVQHKGGRPKRISRIGCRVKTELGDGYSPNSDFGHTCDTEGGSSGSPVLSTEMKVIGLHHLGRQRSGRWANENRAVRMDRLFAVLPLSNSTRPPQPLSGNPPQSAVESRGSGSPL